MVLLLSDIFSKDIETEAGKIIKMRQSNHAAEVAEEMVISIDHQYPSVVYNKFHIVQHLASMYPQQLTRESVENLLDSLTECYTYNTFTTSTIRHALYTVHQLMMMIMARNAGLVTRGVIEKLVGFFATQPNLSRVSAMTLDQSSGNPVNDAGTLGANQENGKLEVCLG